jgi:glutamine amidotransferase
VIGLVDYGAGNFASVRNALHFIGAGVKPVTCPGDFKETTHVVLPGVGSFGVAMRKLRDRGLLEPLKEAVLERKKWFLGICVGLQILAEKGYEDGVYEGLAWIAGNAVKIDTSSSGLPLPHIGWNPVTAVSANPLFRGLASPVFYFVHSFHLEPRNPGDVAATCEYGTRVTAAVSRDHIFGVQFHPEKSQQDGLKLLANFVSL